jgi:hypothetical protein
LFATTAIWSVWSGNTRPLQRGPAQHIARSRRAYDARRPTTWDPEDPCPQASRGPPPSLRPKGCLMAAHGFSPGQDGTLQGPKSARTKLSRSGSPLNERATPKIASRPFPCSAVYITTTGVPCECGHEESPPRRMRRCFQGQIRVQDGVQDDEPVGPSSHCSPATGFTMESPQRDVVQLPLQRAVGPPSSHCSPAMVFTTPSPHFAIVQLALHHCVNRPGVPGSHCSPAAGFTMESPHAEAVQFMLHAAVKPAAPGSHCSPDDTRPSPQMAHSRLGFDCGVKRGAGTAIFGVPPVSTPSVPPHPVRIAATIGHFQ